MAGKIDPLFENHPEVVAVRQRQEEGWNKLFGPKPGVRPAGSNADEWHLFLDEHKDALPFLAVQIAEAIEEAERRGRGQL